MRDENLKLKTLIAGVPEQVIRAAGGIPLSIEDNPRIPQGTKKELNKLKKDAKEWKDKYFQLFHQRPIEK